MRLRMAAGALVAALIINAAYMSDAEAQQAPAEDSKNATYRIALVPWTGWSVAHVALYRGFWKKRGLDVRIFNLATNNDVQKAVRDGLVDFGFEMIGSLVDLRRAGQDVVLLAETDWSHGGDKVVLQSGADADVLKNKPIGVYQKTTAVTFFLDKALTSQGLRVKDCRLVELPAQELAAQFVRGTVGAAVLYDPHAAQAVDEGGGRAAATTADFSGVMPEGLYALADRADAIPFEDMKALLAGLVEAAEWIADPPNRDEFHRILNQATFSKDAAYTKKELQAFVDSVVIHDAEALRRRNFRPDGVRAWCADVNRFLSENDLAHDDVEADALLRLDALDAALKQFETPGAAAPRTEEEAPESE